MNVTRYYGYVDGKLRTIKTNGETKNYTYNNRGQLYQVINAQGNVEQSYTYDNYGNRTSVAYSETDLPYVLYEWERGSKLKGITAYPHFYYGYTYDKDGIRSEKVIKEGLVEKFKIRYHYNGATLLGEDRSDGRKIRYFYDQQGVCGAQYNGQTYVFVKNVLGDVVMLLKNGEAVARYVYDAFGNCSVAYANDDFATINPIRYRGYYYDVESGLYYLQSRYYDPEVGVFLSMDSAEYLAPEEINGADLYAYCRYNPVFYRQNSEISSGKGISTSQLNSNSLSSIMGESFIKAMVAYNTVFEQFDSQIGYISGALEGALNFLKAPKGMGIPSVSSFSDHLGEFGKAMIILGTVLDWGISAYGNFSNPNYTLGQAIGATVMDAGYYTIKGLGIYALGNVVGNLAISAGTAVGAALFVTAGFGWALVAGVVVAGLIVVVGGIIISIAGDLLDLGYEWVKKQIFK